MMEAFLERMVTAMVTAAKGAGSKEPDELTELEKVALAYCAGLAYRTKWTDEGKLRVDIVDLFGIQKINGKFIVAHKKPSPRGETLSLRPDSKQLGAAVTVSATQLAMQKEQETGNR